MDCDEEMTENEDSHNEIVVKIPLLTFKFDPVNFPLYELARDEGMRGENRHGHLSIISTRLLTGCQIPRENLRKKSL